MEDLFGHSTATKSLSCEVVNYELFIIQSEEATLEVLEEYKVRCLAHVTSLTKEYVWHNEGFNLAISNSCDIPCLEGATDFGDFIEDEWLVVWLLYQISKKMANVIAKVKDADGEFLLIESADFLPKWLNIDTSKDRVFIHGGRTHIVTQPVNPGQIAKLPIGQPTLESALQSVQHYPDLTQAHPDIERCIRKRVDKFPAALKEHVQKTNVFIPEIIAKILDKDKSLISVAIRAFYFRDPIDLKSCRIFKEFPPNTRVWSQVSMNRCGYAQLMQQIFNADKRSGYSVPKNAGNDFKGMDLGCKIAHGFEIICASCPNDDGSKSTFSEHSFEKYVAALRNRDYFCGELEGSRRHNELIANARSFFMRFSSESLRNDSQSISKTAGQRIHQIKREIVDNSGCITANFLIKEKRSELPPEDHDEWMYLSDGKMDEMLAEMKNGFQKLGKSNVNVRHEEEDSFHDLSKRMQAFITNMSDYEGVERMDDKADVKFDPLEFENALKRLCEIPEDDESLSDDFLSSEDEDISENEEFSHKDSGIHDAMRQMDNELASTDIGKSFVKEHSVEDHYNPVDIDLNLVQNFLQSCESETDMPGAATTLLHSLGLKLDSTPT